MHTYNINRFTYRIHRMGNRLYASALFCCCLKISWVWYFGFTVLVALPRCYGKSILKSGWMCVRCEFRFCLFAVDFSALVSDEYKQLRYWKVPGLAYIHKTVDVTTLAHIYICSVWRTTHSDSASHVASLYRYNLYIFSIPIGVQQIFLFHKS